MLHYFLAGPISHSPRFSPLIHSHIGVLDNFGVEYLLDDSRSPPTQFLPSPILPHDYGLTLSHTSELVCVPVLFTHSDELSVSTTIKIAICSHSPPTTIPFPHSADELSVSGEIWNTPMHNLPPPNSWQFARFFPTFAGSPKAIVCFRLWNQVLTMLALLSVLITPVQFSFFEVLPGRLIYMEVLEVLFLLDSVLEVLATIIDTPRDTRRRYILIHLPNIIVCIPWVLFYKVSGRQEVMRWIILSRMVRLKKVHHLFSMTEDYWVGFFSTHAMKILAIKLIAFHLGGCAFFYSAIVMRPEKTWLGSFMLGEFRSLDFRHIGLWRLYITCLYFSAITITTVGYGDIHPVSSPDMIIAIIIALSCYFLDSYINRFIKRPQEMTKPLEIISSTEQNSDQMRPRQEPLAIRLQKLRDLHRLCIQSVPLFKDCSIQFINEIASRVHEEEFEQGELVIERGYILQHMYFISSGELEMLPETGGPEIMPFLEKQYSIGEISILHDVPQPYDVKVLQPCTLLRIDKKTLNNLMSTYVNDGRRVLENLSKFQAMQSDVHESNKSPQELLKDDFMRAMKANLLAYFDDESIREEPDVNLKDYSGKTALHIVASRGLEKMTRILIEEKGANIDDCDDSGRSPLLLAIEGKHENVIDIIIKKGPKLMIEDHAHLLCLAVATDDVGYVRHLLACGLVADSQNKDGQTPLHIAARRGCLDIVKLLIQNGARSRTDRWGVTPLDEAGLNREMMDELQPLSYWSTTQSHEGQIIEEDDVKVKEDET